MADTKPRRAERLPETRPDPTIRDLKRNLDRPDDADAFLPDPTELDEPITDPDASFAEEFIQSATTGETVDEDARDEIADDEDGGPFIIESDETAGAVDHPPEWKRGR